MMLLKRKTNDSKRSVLCTDFVIFPEMIIKINLMSQLKINKTVSESFTD